MRTGLLAVVIISLSGCGNAESPKATAPATGESAPGSGATSASGGTGPSSAASATAEIIEASAAFPVFKHGSVGFDITPDAKRFVMAGEDKEDNYDFVLIRVCDGESGKLIKEFKSEMLVAPVAIVPDGKQVAFGTRDAIRIVDVASGETLHELKRKDSSLSVDKIDLSAGGKSLWCNDEEEMVEFTLESGEENRVLKSRDSRIESFEVLPDGKHLAVGYRNGGTHLFDLSTGEARVLDPGNKDDPPPGETAVETKPIAFTGTKDGQLLVIARNGTVELWDLTKGEKLRSLQVGKHASSDSLVLAANDVIVIAQGAWLTADGQTDHSQRAVSSEPIHAFDAASGHRRAYLPIPGDGLLESHAWDIALTADGKRLFAGVANGSVRVFDVSRWK